MSPVLTENIQYAISGISIGCIYGLVALGFVLIYKATDVLNFAQGDFMMLGAFIAFSLITSAKIPYWMAFIGSVVLMGIFGALFDRIVVRPLLGQPVFSIVFVTFGFGYLVRAVVSMIPGWGTETYGFRTPFTEKFVREAGLVVSWEHFAIIILTTALILLFYAFFKYTRVGIAMQATAENQLAAVYMGVSIKTVFSLTWAISAAVGAFAGVLLAPITFVHMGMGYIGLKALPAAVLGGFNSIPGAIVGGVIIGITESFAGIYLPIGWKDIAAYIILILVLILRPQGLFGIQEKKRV